MLNSIYIYLQWPFDVKTSFVNCPNFPTSFFIVGGNMDYLFFNNDKRLAIILLFLLDTRLAVHYRQFTIARHPLPSSLLNI